MFLSIVKDSRISYPVKITNVEERASRSTRIGSPELAEGDQSAAQFIPQTESHALKSLEKGNRPDCFEHGIAFMTALQFVVRYTRTQVMDVMEPDVP